MKLGELLVFPRRVWWGILEATNVFFRRPHPHHRPDKAVPIVSTVIPFGGYLIGPGPTSRMLSGQIG